MRKVKCLYCEEQFSREQEEFVQVGKRYAHKECFERNLLQKSKEEKYKTLLEEYIVKLYGQILPLHRKQIKTLIDNGYDHSTIYKTLFYFYDIKGNTTEKSRGIGIVPYVVGDARAHYMKMNSLKKDAENLNSKTLDTNDIVVRIKSPQAVRKTVKLVDFDLLEGEVLNDK